MSTSLLTPKNEGSPAITQVKKKILKEEKQILVLTVFA